MLSIPFGDAEISKLFEMMLYLAAPERFEIVSDDTPDTAILKPHQCEDLRRILSQAPEGAALSSMVEFVQRHKCGRIETLDWESAKDALRPRIVSKHKLDAMGGALLPNIPQPNDTALVYVRDSQCHVIYVRVDEMEAWGQTPESLKEVSLQNLSKSSSQLNVIERDESSEGTILVLTEDEDHCAGHLLLPELYKRLAGELGHEFLVGIPNNSLMVAFSGVSEAMVARARAAITERFETMPFPITDLIFKVTKDGVFAESNAA